MKRKKWTWLKIVLVVMAVLVIKVMFFSKKTYCSVCVGEYRDSDW